MSITAAEERRLLAAEKKINEIIAAIRGVGSKDQLNRLYIVYDRELDRIETKVDALETEVQKVLELARKVQ
jgi:hypothetical protein